MSGFWLHNLGFYSLQIAVVLLVGGAVLELLRVRMPSCRLWLWQALLIICVLLPLAEPYAESSPEAGVRVSVASTALAVGPRAEPAGITLAQLTAAILLAGTFVRFAFLILGFYRLRRYRRESELAPSAGLALQKRIGVTAEIRVLDTIPGPVTFGLFRPVVIVPGRWIDNESILCHELIHVRRKDWLVHAAEECIRAIFWFHPLVWWAIAKIQLAREEVVDREVVTITAAPARYLETLLEIAAAKSGLELAPAPLFLRNRHLRQRVASLLKEVHMSRKRLSLATASFCAAIIGTAWFAVHAFPLQAAPQQQAGDFPIAHKVQPQYPAEAKEKHIEGDVAIRIQVDQHGLVAAAQVISGPDELKQAALTAVRQWTFTKTAQLPATTDVQVSFRLEEGKVEPHSNLPGVQTTPSNDGVQRIRVGGNVQSTNLITKVSPAYPPEAKQARVQGRVRLNVLIGEDGVVKDVVLIEGQPVLADAAIPAVWQWVYRPTLLNGQPVEVVTQVDVNFSLLP